MNYSDLTARIQETTENTFEAAQLALFAEQAEQFIYSSVQFPALRKNQTGTLTADNQYLSLPSDFLNVNSLAVVDSDGLYTYLLQKDVNFIREAYPNPTSTSIPKHYAHFDSDSLLIGPTPDESYTVQLNYGYYPESIVTAGTTWLSINFETALFNTCLFEAARFMKSDPDTVALYKDMRDTSLVQLKSLGEGKLRRDNYRSVQNRSNVL